jgi:hypothetical protein
MIDHANCIIQQVSAHFIGNITNGEELHLSKKPLDISDMELKELLMKFFEQPFKNTELYNFTFSNNDFNLNTIYSYALNIFNEKSKFHEYSVNIAKQLYEVSVHPNIKSGDLFVAYFTNIQVENELTDAIGIFKSENKQPFLKVEFVADEFEIQFENGINIDKLDKGCIIINAKSEQGYMVSIIDKSNKSGEAQYWKDNFLQLKPSADEYHYTKDFLTITKNFVTKQFSNDFEVTKADQIDLLNRSVDYFKSHDTFEKNDFEHEVFQDEKLIKSFQNFDEIYRESNNLELSNSFDISAQAVKKQAKVFKSVLKLDKNFHIYIHGNRELIERGVEHDGRKYYKIYYDNEQ